MSLMTLVAAGLLIQNTFTAFNVIQRKLNVIQKKKKKEKLSTVGAVCILKQKVQKIKYEVLNDNKSTFKLQFFSIHLNINIYTPPFLKGSFKPFSKHNIMSVIYNIISGGNIIAII